ncbi:hypothetical protein GCM10023189_37790 [Nibrella saemangeumensis]|uniref:Uncharacterized protein n=1 Tax=Nibrella saemangeumensis TaxID=1084526 RepID=A0ABP8N9D3_9BACT
MELPEYIKTFVTIVLTLMTGFFSWYGIVHDYKDENKKVTKQGKIAVLGIILSGALNILITYIDIEKEYHKSKQERRISEQNDRLQRKRQNELLKSIGETLAKQDSTIQKMDKSIILTSEALNQQSAATLLLKSSVERQQESIKKQSELINIANRIKRGPLPKNLHATLEFYVLPFEKHNIPLTLKKMSFKKDSSITVSKEVYNIILENSIDFREFRHRTHEIFVNIIDEKSYQTEDWMLKKLAFKTKKFTLDSIYWEPLDYNLISGKLRIRVENIQLLNIQPSYQIRDITDLENSIIDFYEFHRGYIRPKEISLHLEGFLDKTIAIADAIFMNDKDEARLKLQ